MHQRSLARAFAAFRFTSASAYMYQIKLLRICDKYQSVMCWPISGAEVLGGVFGDMRLLEAGKAGFGIRLG